MGIVLRHDAAGIPLGRDKDGQKYGQMLVAQQRKYDLEQMQSDRDNQYRMGQIGAMRNYNAAPSIGEDDAMIEQEIRSGMYDPDVVKSLRDDQRAMRLIMRDKDIDGTQRAQALDNLRSRMRMQRSTGKVQPMVQAQPSAPRQPLTAAQAFAQSDKLEERFMGMVEPTNPDGTPMPYEERLKRAMSIYDTRQKMLFGQPQEQASPQQSVPPAGGSQSQVGYRIQGQGPADPKGVNMVLQSYPPQYVLNDGTRVDSVWKNGRWAPDVDQTGPRSQLLSGNQQPASPAMQGQATASVPGGSQSMSFGGERVFGVDPVPATPLPASSAQSPELANAPSGVRPAPNGSIYGDQGQYLGNTDLYNQAGANYIRQQASPQIAQSQPSPRKWTSADGKYSTDGEFLGVSNPTDGGEPMVKIKKTDGNVVDVPWSKLSDQDRMFASAGGNRDTMYDLQNRGRTPGTNFMDPENPVYKEMRSPQSQQQPNQGQFMGRYGLGGVDYGINQSTGNRVTASIRPGATAVEYDEPVGPPGTAMGGRKGSLSITGRRRQPSQAVSPGEPSAADQARYDALPMSPQNGSFVISRNDPRVREAEAIAINPNSTPQQQQQAAIVFKNAGYTEEEVASLISKSKSVASGQSPMPTAAPQVTVDELNRRSNAFERGSGSNFGASSNQPSNLNQAASEMLRAIPNAVSGYMSGWEGYKDPEPARPMNEWSSGQLINSARSANKKSGVKIKDQELIDRINSENPQTAGVSMDGGIAGSSNNQVASASPVSTSSDLRTWTSADGRTFEGTLVEGSLSAAAKQDGGIRMVTVKRKDGQFFNIPIENLSEDDKSYLDSLWKIQNKQSAYYRPDGLGESVLLGESYKYEKPKTSSKASSKSKYKNREETPRSVIDRVKKEVNYPKNSPSVTGRRTS
jgi:hypothetical protein